MNSDPAKSQPATSVPLTANSPLIPDHTPLHIMVLTGEPSGDFHAAPLIKALKQLVPGVRISGIGGPAMAGQGTEIFFPIERLSAMGLIQVARQFSTIQQAFRKVQQCIRTDRPHAVVLIDYPGFNLKVAQYIQTHHNIPVCYYIAPKVWAWNAARLKKIKAYTDHVALIFPFERSIYQKRGIAATYVGNPLMDEYPPQPFRPVTGNKKLTGNTPIIGFLPGSRSSEINKLLPVMLDAALNIVHRHENARFLVSSGIELHEGRIRDIVENHPARHLCQIVPGRPVTIFKKADMLVAASGTVTLEAALYGVPTIIIYKMSSLAYALGRLLVKVKYAGLANLITGREVMPELLQGEANPREISRRALAMLDSLDFHKKNLAQVRQRLGTPGAAERTAKIILSLVRKKRFLMPHI